MLVIMTMELDNEQVARATRAKSFNQPRFIHSFIQLSVTLRFGHVLENVDRHEEDWQRHYIQAAAAAEEEANEDQGVSEPHLFKGWAYMR